MLTFAPVEGLSESPKDYTLPHATHTAARASAAPDASLGLRRAQIQVVTAPHTPVAAHKFALKTSTELLRQLDDASRTARRERANLTTVSAKRISCTNESAHELLRRMRSRSRYVELRTPRKRSHR